MFSMEIQAPCRKEWQIEFMKSVKHKDDFTDSERLRKRSIYWLEDTKGGSGKSEFITWLRAGQKDLICRLLPIDSVDRLIHAVTEISKHEKVDVFMIDDTRTQGAFNNMFEAIERIKNGHVVSTMGSNLESPTDYILHKSRHLRLFKKFIAVSYENHRRS